MWSYNERASPGKGVRARRICPELTQIQIVNLSVRVRPETSPQWPASRTVVAHGPASFFCGQGILPWPHAYGGTALRALASPTSRSLMPARPSWLWLPSPHPPSRSPRAGLRPKGSWGALMVPGCCSDVATAHMSCQACAKAFELKEPRTKS